MLDFESCYRELYPSLCVFAFRFLKENAQAEDIVQEAFMKLLDRYSSFDHFFKVKAFLYITVRNSAINILNHNKMENKHIAGETTANNDIADAGLEAAVIENETNRLLYLAIAKLPPQTERVIKLSMEDKTNREIASHMGISIDTVKTLKKRAYRILREELSENYLWIIMLPSIFLS